MPHHKKRIKRGRMLELVHQSNPIELKKPNYNVPIMLNRANKTGRLSKCNFYRNKLWTQLPVFILLTVKVYVDFASSIIAEDRKKILGVMFLFPKKTRSMGYF